MNVLITGASGFIGRALSLRFDAAWTLPGTRPPPPGVRSWTEPGLPPVDVVFHLAWPVDPSRGADPGPQRAAVSATKELAERCQRSDTRLVFVGTCEEYGDGPAPFREDQPGQPVSPYSRAKLEATEWLMAQPDLRVTVARPFLTYGPGQGGERLIPAAIRAALEGAPFRMSWGEQTREVNFVDDIARGIALCADPAVEGEIVNIGGGPELSVFELVCRIYERAGADSTWIERGALPTRSGEVPRFFGDHTKALERLGFQPEVTLNEGLDRTIVARKRWTG